MGENNVNQRKLWKHCTSKKLKALMDTHNLKVTTRQTRRQQSKETERETDRRKDLAAWREVERWRGRVNWTGNSISCTWLNHLTGKVHFHPQNVSVLWCLVVAWSIKNNYIESKSAWGGKLLQSCSPSILTGVTPCATNQDCPNGWQESI